MTGTVKAALLLLLFTASLAVAEHQAADDEQDFRLNALISKFKEELSRTAHYDVKPTQGSIDSPFIRPDDTRGAGGDPFATALHITMDDHQEQQSVTNLEEEAATEIIDKLKDLSYLSPVNFNSHVDYLDHLYNREDFFTKFEPYLAKFLEAYPIFAEKVHKDGLLVSVAEQMLFPVQKPVHGKQSDLLEKDCFPETLLELYKIVLKFLVAKFPGLFSLNS